MSFIGDAWNQLTGGKSRSSTSKVEDSADELDEAVDTGLDAMEKITLAVASIIMPMVAVELAAAARRIEAVDNAVSTVTGQLGYLESAYEVTADVVRQVKLKVDGVLDLAGVQASITTLRLLHRVGMLTSQTYRDSIISLYDETRNLSRSVFGDAATVSAALQLIQLTTQDVTRLNGEPYDVGENAWFAASLSLADRVELKSRTYSRNPGAFWADVSTLYVRPNQEAASLTSRRERTRLSAAIGTLNMIGGNLTALDDRFNLYRAELAPFLTKEKLNWLDDLQRDFQTEVLTPLTEATRLVEITFPLVVDRVEDVEDEVVEHGYRLHTVETLTADPADLPDPARAAQNARVTAWMNSATDDAGAAEIGRLRSSQRLEALFLQINQR